MFPKAILESKVALNAHYGHLLVAGQADYEDWLQLITV